MHGVVCAVLRSLLAVKQSGLEKSLSLVALSIDFYRFLRQSILFERQRDAICMWLLKHGISSDSCPRHCLILRAKCRPVVAAANFVASAPRASSGAVVTKRPKTRPGPEARQKLIEKKKEQTDVLSYIITQHHHHAKVGHKKTLNCSQPQQQHHDDESSSFAVIQCNDQQQRPAIRRRHKWQQQQQIAGRSRVLCR
jgi:hypothetical protein